MLLYGWGYINGRKNQSQQILSKFVISGRG